MKLQQRCILTLSLCAGMAALTGHANNTVLAHDQEALTYCHATPTTYVGIVWPKGFKNLDYVLSTLNKHAQVKYVKKIAFDTRGLFKLYRHVHKRLSYKSSKKYFGPYLPVQGKQSWEIAAIVIETDQSLETIQSWKKEIRDTIGCGYQAFHINDHYPETIEAADVLFDKDQGVL